MAADPRPCVLLTADTVGGVWTYAVELARALDARGVRVHIATMGAAVRPDQRAQLADCAGVTLHESEYLLEWMDAPWRDVDHAGDWLLSLERTLRPDLVHLNQFAFGALPFAAPTLLVAHSCVLSWWRAVHRAPAPPTWDGYRQRVADGLAGATLVAAPTRAMLATLRANYNHRGGGRVLANARDPRLFAPADKQSCVFSAGRFWDEAKNLRTLAQAAPQLPWPVRVAGPRTSPDGRSVDADGVELLGELSQEEIARQLAGASIYALPASYEPFGLSVLEAALAGCALVLGDIASLREVWGPAALYVPPDDADALRRAIRRLVQSPGERAVLAAAARARAAHYTPARLAQGYLEAYASIAPAFRSTLQKELQCA